MMARSLVQSKNIALGAFYRRLAARRGGLVANVALARKLAVLFWRVMVKGLNYAEAGLKAYEEQVLETKRRALGFLARRFSGKSWATGEVMVPEAALAPLAAEGFKFTVEGPATYERIAPLRDTPATAVQ